MNLEDKSTKELLALHNGISDVPSGQRTFATKYKLVARIRSLAAAKNIDLELHAKTGAPAGSSEKQEPGKGSPADQEPKKRKLRGLGIARMFTMDRSSHPHSLMSAMVNPQIPGATATEKSLRRYAAKREEGMEVPRRPKAFAASTDQQQSKDWSETFSVVAEPAR